MDAHGGEPMVPFCGALEAKLVSLGEAEGKKYLEDLKTQVEYLLIAINEFIE